MHPLRRNPAHSAHSVPPTRHTLRNDTPHPAFRKLPPRATSDTAFRPPHFGQLSLRGGRRPSGRTVRRLGREAAARAAALLICDAPSADEALAPEAARYGHSPFRQTAALAARAGARRLWLAHYSPRIEDPEAALPLAQAVFPAAECGFDGKSVTLPFTES